MHIISRKPFTDAAKKHPNDAQAIKDIYKVLKKGVFSKPEELQAIFPSLDNSKNNY